MPQPLTSLRRCGVSLRPTSAASFPAWHSQSPAARMCPLIPRGHLAMCPQPEASLFTPTSSRRFRPVAYAERSSNSPCLPPTLPPLPIRREIPRRSPQSPIATSAQDILLALGCEFEECSLVPCEPGRVATG